MNTLASDGKIDNTHLSLKGATAYAGLVAEDIRGRNSRFQTG
ncbi:MAG: hypothetical protein R3B47_10200 [Bacteroidia bacterium]